MIGKSWILIGSLSAGIAVILGAFAAHGLESWVSAHFPADAEKRMANWKIGATYQMYHSLGLILLGLVAQYTGRKRLISVAGFAMTLGILLFSGMLYGWVLTDSKPLVMIVPIGGIGFIVGWIALAGAVIAMKTPTNESCGKDNS